jgi:hypothetical protein
MGRFYAIVFLLAACGDNEPGPVTVDNSQQPAGAGGALQTPTREVPQVCAELQWTSTGVATTDVHLSISARQGDFAILGVPTAGGELDGFRIDAASKADSTITTVPIGTGGFTSVGLSRVDGRLVTAAGDGNAVHVALLDDDLSNPVEVAKLPGTAAMSQAMLLADGTRMVPIAGDTGVTLVSFDSSWQPVSSIPLATTSAPTSYAAAQLGGAMLVGWSTIDSCYLATVYTGNAFGPNDVTSLSQPCASPRIATTLIDGTDSFVFEAPDGVRLMHVSQLKKGGSSQLLRANATSPRVLFDGTHTWVSYLDERGEIVVGFLTNEADPIISTAVSGIQPQHDGYDLAMFDGTPWVFALDGNGYTAHRLCVAEQ